MHVPVLLQEVIELIGKSKCLNDAKANDYILDATFGAGGYSRKILESFPKMSLVGIDRDPSVEAIAKEISNEFGGRFKFVNTVFSKLEQVVNSVPFGSLKCIVVDFGISSMHIDNADRGFSFMKDAKLDMRMGCNSSGESAYDFVNSATEERIANVLYTYGDERLSRKIAYNIIHFRRNQKIVTTKELSDIVYKSYGKLARMQSIHPATKTFQAIRIYINNELEEIELLLDNALELLCSGGLLLCVSFHSLEDTIVKDFFNQYNRNRGKVNKYQKFSNFQGAGEAEKSEVVSDELLDCAEVHLELEQMKRNDLENTGDSLLTVLTKKPVVPSKEEIVRNPRSRSAKLRAAVKI